MAPAGFTPLDEFNYHPRLTATDGLAVVMFSSPTCGTCRQVERLLPTASPPAIKLFHVDVQRNLGLARAFDLFHLPALFLYRNGHYHARLNTDVTPTGLRQAIDRALAAPAEEEP
mgnify:CR=1 FL=1